MIRSFFSKKRSHQKNDVYSSAFLYSYFLTKMDLIGTNDQMIAVEIFKIEPVTVFNFCRQFDAFILHICIRLFDIVCIKMKKWRIENVVW